MRMSNNSYSKMNALITMCFSLNALYDNLAYNLDYLYYNRIAEVVHHNVAHVMPEWADMVSDKMLELSARPIREALPGYAEEFTNVKGIFTTLNASLEDLRGQVRGLIEDADIDGDDEVRIFGEEFLDKCVSPFIKQSEEWMCASSRIDADTLNIHFKEYTHFIAL